MKYKTLLEAFKINEAIQVEGATLVGTRNGYDIFNMTTFAACQQFVDANNNPAGTKWVQNENTFNQHINARTPLYFIVRENTNIVVAGVMMSNTNNTIQCEDGNSIVANLNVEDDEGASRLPSSDVPLDLIPNVHIQSNNEEEVEVDEPTDDALENDENEEESDVEDSEEGVQEQPQDSESSPAIPRVRTDGYYVYDNDGHLYDRISGEYYEYDLKEPVYKYKIVGEEAKLIWVSRYIQTVNVADTYQGKPVTTIGSFAFYNNKRVRTIKMRNLKVIEKDAFAGIPENNYYYFDVDRETNANNIVCKDATLRKLIRTSHVYFRH